ncbi:MAG: hypothetical protein FWC27_14135 [Firmicutes bacterium]|nr:hypothetical protein [Bacillota bacterium]
MKKIFGLLCALALAASLLAACSQKPSNGASDSPGDNLHPRDHQFSADWPENDFTGQLPKPAFDTALTEPGEAEEYSIVCEATVEQLKEYVESLKAAGFTQDANTTDENAFSVVAYSYTASNEEGYTVEVNYSNMLGSLSTVTVKKPLGYIE